MRPSAALLVVMLGLAGPVWLGATPAVSQNTQPFTMIRTLQIMQEQIAHGNAKAQAAQPQFMDHIAERFLAADADVWREPRNARAAVLFLLSGGKPSVIRTILSRATMPPDMDRLVKGALAYGEGSDDAARDLLGGIDPRSLPSMLGGHLALVQATLLSDQDRAKAGKLLDLARLLVPGTLVEEAALRRQIFALAGPDTFDKFIFLSRQYVRRFRASVYAENFKQRLTSFATKLAAADDIARLSKLDAVLSELPVAEQLAFNLTVAKAAIVQGKATAARYAAEKAAALAADQSADGARSKLYAGAALIVSDDSGKGEKTLESIDRSRLSPQDAELRDAALAVATGVRAEVAETAGAAVAPQGEAAADTSSLAILDRARDVLADTDKLLQEKAP